MTYEPYVRVGVFLVVLILMSLWEVVAPRRSLSASKPIRWLSNLGLVLLNTGVVRVLLTLGAVGVAVVAVERQWGWLNQFAMPLWLAIVLAVLLLDFVIYLQHVLFHAVPLLWRLHLVHHADPGVDVTTGLRFHTLEIVLSMGLKVAVILALGPPPLAVLVFEALLNATSMFNHSNVKMPVRLDRVLRLFLVTPDMHRVHHSTLPRETNSNYGFNLPWWDFLFRTYRAQPAAGHEMMPLGLTQIDPHRAIRLPWMLIMPLLNQATSYARDANDDDDSTADY